MTEMETTDLSWDDLGAVQSIRQQYAQRNLRPPHPNNSNSNVKPSISGIRKVCPHYQTGTCTMIIKMVTFCTGTFVPIVLTQSLRHFPIGNKNAVEKRVKCCKAQVLGRGAVALGAPSTNVTACPCVLTLPQERRCNAFDCIDCIDSDSEINSNVVYYDPVDNLLSRNAVNGQWPQQVSSSDVYL